MRLGRSAENQVQGFHQDALPFVDQKVIIARPITFSTGTIPIPPTSAGNRLSRLSSRLSPIRNRRPAGTVTGPKSSASVAAWSSTVKLGPPGNVSSYAGKTQYA